MTDMTISEQNGKWTALLTRGNSSTLVHCESRGDAEAIADVGRVLADFDKGEKCSEDRVHRCMDALDRYGYRFPDHSLARELQHFVNKLAEMNEEWA